MPRRNNSGLVKRILVLACLWTGAAFASWLPFSNLPGTVYRLAVSERGLLAGTYTNGVFLDNRKVGWSRTLAARDFVSALAASGRFVYAGVQFCNPTGYCSNLGVFASQDGGRSWKPTGLKGRYIRQIAIDPGDPGKLAAATLQGLYASTDAGKTWGRLLAAPALSVSIDPWNPAVWFVGGAGRGVFQSNDSGLHWRQVPLGDGYLPAVAAGPAGLRLAGSSSCDDAGCSGDLFISTDSGGHWRAMGLDSGIDRIRINSAHPDEIAVGTYVDGLFLSSDGGRRFAHIFPSPYNYDVTDLLFTDRGLVVSLFGGNLYRHE